MGLLNSFLQAIGLDNLAKVWLGSKKTAMYAVIAVSQWQSTGYTTMLFIVAILSVLGFFHWIAVLSRLLRLMAQVKSHGFSISPFRR